MQFSSGSSPSRRGFLALAAAAAVGVATPISALSSAAIDLTQPAGRLKAFMLMRGALDDQLVIGCVSARYYGVVDDLLTPLFGVVAATFARYRPAPGGGFAGVSQEIAYFTDLASGLVMEKWHNPFTEEEVVVPEAAPPPSKIAIAPDLTLSVPNAPPGLHLTHLVRPPLIIGDDCWMTEETEASIQIPGQPRPTRYSEFVTLHARSVDLAQSGVTKVPCQTAYSSVSSWRSWMKMGDRPGHLLADGAGRYGVGLDELPAPWLATVRARRPQLLADPGAGLAALWAAP